MKIVVPLAYTVRGIPKNGRVERDLHVVELIDWELREADETEAPIGLIAVVKNGHPTLRERDQLVIRRFEGGFLRHASEAEYNCYADWNVGSFCRQTSFDMPSRVR